MLSIFFYLQIYSIFSFAFISVSLIHETTSIVLNEYNNICYIRDGSTCIFKQRYDQSSDDINNILESENIDKIGTNNNANHRTLFTMTVFPSLRGI